MPFFGRLFSLADSWRRTISSSSRKSFRGFPVKRSTNIQWGSHVRDFAETVILPFHKKEKPRMVTYMRRWYWVFPGGQPLQQPQRGNAMRFCGIRKPSSSLSLSPARMWYPGMKWAVLLSQKCLYPCRCFLTGGYLNKNNCGLCCSRISI